LWTDGIPNESLRHIPRSLVYLTFIQSLPSAVPFPKALEGRKSHDVTETRRGSKIPSTFTFIRLLSTTGKIFENVILKIVQRHIEERCLLNASQFGFRARHSTELQCIRLTDQVTLTFNNMSTAAVFLDIEKDFDTTWQLRLLYKLSKLKLSISLLKLISSFLRENSETRLKVKRPRQGIYNQGCHNVPSCPHIVQYIYV
jgi:hypothetical protein